MPTTNGQFVVSESQAFKSRISSLPNVKKFLQPGSQRKPPMDAKQIQEARKAFKIQ
jgi:glutathione S-transferase